MDDAAGGGTIDDGASADAGPDSDADGGERRLRSRSAILLAGVFLVGVAGSGVARRLLGQAGLETIGTLVFVAGYAGMVFVVWYGWIRPLDITGPVERAEPDDPGE
jgi:cation transporter-like permease